MKKKPPKTPDVPAEQGEHQEVGPGNPPKEHRFKPGESGNPKGSPKRRTNLWIWFCKSSEMTNAEFRKLKVSQLTQAQQAARRMVMRFRAGESCGAERMARYIVDREEGKAAEHLIIDKENDLSDTECEELRGLIRKNHGSDTDE